jgi:hypothetical protein
MIDDPFMVPRPPLMTAEAARDLARMYKGFADHLSGLGVRSEATRMERDSQWWLAYSIALAQTPPARDSST